MYCFHFQNRDVNQDSNKQETTRKLVAWLALQTWKSRQEVSPKLRKNSNWPNGNTSQETVFYVVAAIRTSNPRTSLHIYLKFIWCPHTNLLVVSCLIFVLMLLYLVWFSTIHFNVILLWPCCFWSSLFHRLQYREEQTIDWKHGN
jgi:hypothetical protein